MGLVGGFGVGTDALRQATEAGKTLPSAVSMDSAAGEIEVPALLADTSELAAFVPKRALRRIDHYTRMALLGCYLTLEDAGIPDAAQERLGIIVATGYGATCNTFDFQNSVIGIDDPCGSPTKFSNSVHNAAAAHISIFLKAMGPNLSVSHYDMSVPSAFLSACQWLAEDRADAVLVGGVDEYCKVLGYYWHCVHGNGPSELQAKHALIGEGSAFFLLTRDHGETPRYGMIEDVSMGSFTHGELSLPEDALCLVSADGYSDCDGHYARHVGNQTPVASYAGIYGGIPVGMGFDMAIAAQAMQTGRIHASAETTTLSHDSLNLITEAQELGSRKICCLKLGAGGEFGMVLLGK